MLDILQVTFPFFALVLCGYVAGRYRMLPFQAISGLNSFVLFFALPCMLFRFGAATPIRHLLDPAALLVYLLCALVLAALLVGASLNPRVRWNDAAFGTLVAVFPNTGFMGVPLLVALLGEAAAGPAILTLTIDLIVTTSLCIGLSRLDGADQHGAAVAARNALKGMALNPMAWSIALGAVASALQLEPIRPVGQTIRLLADAASPVALFTIGAVLARSQYVAAMEVHHPMPLRDYLPLVLVKLVVHPVVVLGAGSLAIALGASLGRFTSSVMVLVAALPSASNVSVLAERFGADTGRIARIILLTTALAFVSFSGVVVLLR